MKSKKKVQESNQYKDKEIIRLLNIRTLDDKQKHTASTKQKTYATIEENLRTFEGFYEGEMARKQLLSERESIMNKKSCNQRMIQNNLSPFSGDEKSIDKKQKIGEEKLVIFNQAINKLSEQNQISKKNKFQGNQKKLKNKKKCTKKKQPVNSPQNTQIVKKINNFIDTNIKGAQFTAVTSATNTIKTPKNSKPKQKTRPISSQINKRQQQARLQFQKQFFNMMNNKAVLANIFHKQAKNNAVKLQNNQQMHIENCIKLKKKLNLGNKNHRQKITELSSEEEQQQFYTQSRQKKQALYTHQKSQSHKISSNADSSYSQNNLSSLLTTSNKKDPKNPQIIRSMKLKIFKTIQKDYPDLQLQQKKILCAIIIIQRLWRQKKVKQFFSRYIVTPKGNNSSQTQPMLFHKDMMMIQKDNNYNRSNINYTNKVISNEIKNLKLNRLNIMTKKPNKIQIPIKNVDLIMMNSGLNLNSNSKVTEQKKSLLDQQQQNFSPLLPQYSNSNNNIIRKQVKQSKFTFLQNFRLQLNQKQNHYQKENSQNLLQLRDNLYLDLESKNNYNRQRNFELKKVAEQYNGMFKYIDLLKDDRNRFGHNNELKRVKSYSNQLKRKNGQMAGQIDTDTKVYSLKQSISQKCLRKGSYSKDFLCKEKEYEQQYLNNKVHEDLMLKKVVKENNYGIKLLAANDSHRQNFDKNGVKQKGNRKLNRILSRESLKHNHKSSIQLFKVISLQVIGKPQLKSQSVEQNHYLTVFSDKLQKQPNVQQINEQMIEKEETGIVPTQNQKNQNIQPSIQKISPTDPFIQQNQQNSSKLPKHHFSCTQQVFIPNNHTQYHRKIYEWNEQDEQQQISLIRNQVRKEHQVGQLQGDNSLRSLQDLGQNKIKQVDELEAIQDKNRQVCIQQIVINKSSQASVKDNSIALEQKVQKPKQQQVVFENNLIINKKSQLQSIPEDSQQLVSQQKQPSNKPQKSPQPTLKQINNVSSQILYILLEQFFQQYISFQQKVISKKKKKVDRSKSSQQNQCQEQNKRKQQNKNKNKLPGMNLNNKSIDQYLSILIEYIFSEQDKNKNKGQNSGQNSEQNKNNKDLMKSMNIFTPSVYQKCHRVYESVIYEIFELERNCNEQQYDEYQNQFGGMEGEKDQKRGNQQQQDELYWNIISNQGFFECLQNYWKRHVVLKPQEEKYKNFIDLTYKIFNRCVTDAFSQLLNKVLLQKIFYPWQRVHLKQNLSFAFRVNRILMNEKQQAGRQILKIQERQIDGQNQNSLCDQQKNIDLQVMNKKNNKLSSSKEYLKNEKILKQISTQVRQNLLNYSNLYSRSGGKLLSSKKTKRQQLQKWVYPNLQQQNETNQQNSPINKFQFFSQKEQKLNSSVDILYELSYNQNLTVQKIVNQEIRQQERQLERVHDQRYEMIGEISQSVFVDLIVEMVKLMEVKLIVD